MTKTNTAPKSAGAKTTPEQKQEQPSQAATQVVTSNESQELKAEIERLKRLIYAGPETIEEKIRYYQKKQELIERLQNLDGSKEVISTHIGEINKEAEIDAFESEQYKLMLTCKNGYSSEKELLKFRNPVIISELLSFVLAKIDGKRQLIEAEINK